MNVDDPITATVYAVDRTEPPAGAQGEIAELRKAGGEIPVLPFDISEQNVEEFMRHAFRRISIRLVRQDLRDNAFFVRATPPTEDL
jgi:hypothetical protein